MLTAFLYHPTILILGGYIQGIQSLVCYDRTCVAGNCSTVDENQRCRSEHACLLKYKPTLIEDIPSVGGNEYVLEASCADVKCDERQQEPLQGITEYCCTADLCNHRFPDVNPGTGTGNEQCYDGGCKNDEDCLMSIVRKKFISVCRMEPQYGCFYNKYVTGNSTTIQVGCARQGASCVPLSGDSPGTQIVATCCYRDLCNVDVTGSSIGVTSGVSLGLVVISSIVSVFIQ